MQRSVLAAAVAVAVGLTATACTRSAPIPTGGTFTSVDASHPISQASPINPYHPTGNAYAGYNAMRLAWPENDPVDPNRFHPGIARSWEVSPEGTQVTVHIQPGARWSDGTQVTGADLKTSAAVAATQGDSLISAAAPGGIGAGAVAEVTVADEATVRFRRAPGTDDTTFLHRLLQMWVLPHAVYGAQLPADVWPLIRISAAADPSDPQAAAGARERLGALGRRLATVGPREDVSCGPFVLANVTADEALLVKNPYFHGAARIVPERVTLRNYPDNPAIWNYLTSGALDAAPYTATPSDVIRRFLGTPNSRKITSPAQAGAALAFNQSHPPFDKVQVRQALAHLIDRAKVQQAGAPDSGTVAEYTTGLVSGAATGWLGAPAVDGLRRYQVDNARADQLLTEAGLSKTAGGWVLDDGRPFTFTIQAPAPLADWVAGAESIAGQLTAFGIPVEVRTSADLATYQREMAAGRYPVGFWPVASGPSAYQAYRGLYGPARGWTSSGGDVRHEPPRSGGTWTGMPETADVPGLGRVDPGALTAQLAQVPIQRQHGAVAALARLTNEQLPVIQMWDYVDVQFVTESRYTNFPASGCGCLRQSPGVWMQLGYIARK